MQLESRNEEVIKERDESRSEQTISCGEEDEDVDIEKEKQEELPEKDGEHEKEMDDCESMEVALETEDDAEKEDEYETADEMAEIEDDTDKNKDEELEPGCNKGGERKEKERKKEVRFARKSQALIPECRNGRNCHFWKRDECRFQHSHPYEAKAPNAAKGEDRVKNNEDNKIKACNFGENCKFWKRNRCRYQHKEKYEEKRCDELSRKANEGEEKRRETKARNNKIEVCRFLRNCKYGKNCTYEHPEEKKAKNGKEGMQEPMHFLQSEMRKIRRDLEESQRLTMKHLEREISKLRSK